MMSVQARLKRAHRRAPWRSRAARVALGLGDRGIGERRLADLHPRDEMAELAELQQHLGGVGAGAIEPLRHLQRRRDLAAHGELEQVDDVAAVGEAEHAAQVGDAARRPSPPWAIA